MSIALSEQEIIRRESLQQLRALGINPYPAEAFDVNAWAQDIKDITYNFIRHADADSQEFAIINVLKKLLDKNPELDMQSYYDAAITTTNPVFMRFDLNEVNRILRENYPVVIAGRIMTRRIMGSASFAEIQDSTGRVQIYLKRDDICPDEDKTLYNTVFKKLLDIGDYVGVKGYVFLTQTGEISVHVRELIVLSKSLKPLPVVKREDDGTIHDGFTDPELRYRQRYVDLTVNPEYKNIFISRSKVISAMRGYFNEQGWMEVETPILQPVHGGAAARPFATHHNTLDMPLFLRIANELYLKRLIVAGFDGVYEFGKMFRNEGMDRTHNPEFTILEFYVAYKDYLWMMDITEQMLEKTAIATNGTSVANVAGTDIDFKAPYRRVSIYDAIKEHTGIDISNMDEAGLRDVCKQLRIDVDDSMGKGKLIDEIFGGKCEAHYVQPTFIIDYPIEMSPLTKKHRSKPGLVERFELIINGKEIANAYSELNDPIDQRERFEEQVKLMERGDEEAMFIDYDFLRALEYGMPPTAGIGIGIERLAMLLTGQVSIQDVLLFPQMRPERAAAISEQQA